MFNIQNEVVRLMQASNENAICISSNAIDAFARAMGIKECAGPREILGQPTLVTLRDEHSNWSYFMHLLCWTTKRAVIAVDEGWLEAYWEEGSRQDRPMAIIYEMIDDELFATEIVLHHSRSDKARLCSMDLKIAYVHCCDGTFGWEILPKAFKKRASIGIQRAGTRYYWDYDEADTEEFMAALHERKDEEGQPSSVQLPGVVITKGRWCKSAAGAQAA